MGVLYIVSTPIGNLEDITIRARRILLGTPVIACEDTRHTGQLLKQLEINPKIQIPNYKDSLNSNIEFPKKFISVRDWNEAEVVDKVLTELEIGDVALVSDAGTPLLSDPGFKIVRAAKAAGNTVIPIPGAFAGAAALSICGLPTNKFMFWGFLPKKWELEAEVTHVIYEAPVRTLATLEKIFAKYSNAQVAVAMELTKIHESVTNFNFSEFSAFSEIQFPNFRGEVVLVVYIPE